MKSESSELDVRKLRAGFRVQCTREAALRSGIVDPAVQPASASPVAAPLPAEFSFAAVGDMCDRIVLKAGEEDKRSAAAVVKSRERLPTGGSSQ